MHTIPHARPDLYHDPRTGDASLPTIFTREKRSAGELVDTFTRAAEVVDAPVPGPDAPDHVRAAHNPAHVSAIRDRLERGRPVSGDLIAILRASAPRYPVIARTPSQTAEGLLDDLPDLIREEELDLEALIMVWAAWLTGNLVPAEYALRADRTLSRHIFQTPEEALLLIREGRETAPRGR